MVDALKTLKKVMKKAMQKALVKEYQNLNSGNLRINGRNSSSRDVGSVCAGERERERERQQRIRAATGGAAAAAVAAAVCCCRRCCCCLLPLLAAARTGPSVSGSLCGERKPISRLST